MMRPKSFLPLVVAFAAVEAKYDEYILAPSSRTLYPVSVYNVNGTVDGASSLASSSPGSATFKDASAVTYDFGKNIGGVITLTIGSVSDANQLIGVTFSESSLWISGNWSDSTADFGNDEPLWFQPSGPGEYTVDKKFQRGGFRYMSLVHNTTGSIEVKQASIYYTALPHLPDDGLRNYSGYFHSDDELVNRIWYAGAYTAQLCTIDPHYGNSLVLLGATETNQTTVPWWSNTTIANASSVLVDGAKRDRLVWPGDMVVTWPSMLVSTHDKTTVTDSLDSLFERQNSTGALPWAGYPFPNVFSATYHLHSLIGVGQIYILDGDLQYVAGKWDKWKLAIDYSLSSVDATGLMNVTSPNDWLRSGMGGHNIEANAILYFALNYGATLATALNDTSAASRYQNYATNIKSAANELLWDSSANLFIDNETTTLHPQDGNVWAVLSNLTLSQEQSQNITRNLIARWTPYGAPAPEAGPTISPFVGNFELQAHAAVSNASAILDLTRLQWGFMLDDPRMTNSTFIEGYSTDGRLHYAPYNTDQRISHAHGWSTGPTSSLSFYVAGVQVVAAGGKKWRIAPRLGGLKKVEAGYSTDVGYFEAKTAVDETGGFRIDFEAPEGTVGAVSAEYPECGGAAVLKNSAGVEMKLGTDVQLKRANDGTQTIEVSDVPGGRWALVVTCA